MQQAAPHFADDEDVLMLYGDVPLISVDTLQRLLAAKPQGGIGLLTVKLDDPSGYGRIVREQATWWASWNTRTPARRSARLTRSIPASGGERARSEALAGDVE